jgi:UDP-N-acetylmuramate--alanine ligase
MNPPLKFDLSAIERIHFIGIGGISMSGLARMCFSQGKEVSGSDRSDSALLEELRNEGVHVAIGHAAENVSPVAQLVVYSAAIPDDNPELIYAREHDISIATRAEFLGAITLQYYTIAVSGTHGKTTASAMLTKVMKDAGLDPTALVGSVMTDYKSNFLAGGERYLVVEACEYERQFLDLEPSMIVITNIEEDHLDYYKDLEDIRQAFRAFALKVPDDGVIVASTSDPSMAVLLRDVPAQLVDYHAMRADGLELRMPGAHNVRNAQAVLAASEKLGVPRPVAIAALNDFAGTWRRFEYKGETSAGVKIYDDYAHHPTAVKTTLAGAREKFVGKRIVLVFQPHLYSRTNDFLQEFAESFTDADEAIVTDIYPAREKPGERLPDGGEVPNVHARDIVAASKHPNIRYVPFDKVAEHLVSTTHAGNVVITMGAGDVFKIGEEFLAA